MSVTIKRDTIVFVYSLLNERYHASALLGTLVSRWTRKLTSAPMCPALLSMHFNFVVALRV